MADFMTSNYHTHTTRCLHADGTEKEYIEAAIEMGITKLGFSDHVPCPFKSDFVSKIRMPFSQAAEYVATIRKLALEYKEQIQIFVGFEMEYIPEFWEEQMSLFHDLDIDYLIMGQHFWVSEEEGPYAGRPTEDDNRIRCYVDSIIAGMATGKFSCLCHPDLMNYQGLDSVYEWEMTRLCKAMKEMQIPLEINMGGMGEGKHYPNEKFWAIAKEIGNQVVIGLDAHAPCMMTDVETYEKCKKIVDKFGLDLQSDLVLKKP